MSPERVYVIDTSAVIDAKKTVPAHEQWELFERLKALVVAGSLCFPRHVRRELSGQRHVDTPEASALNVGELVVHCYDPSQENVDRVMEEAGDVVDPEAEDDPADPYVIAQALDIMELGYDAVVVTNDSVDRLPIKISIVTACQRVGLESMSLTEFLAALAG